MTPTSTSHVCPAGAAALAGLTRRSAAAHSREAAVARTLLHPGAARLRATLDYAQVDEIMESGLGNYLIDIQSRCHEIHEAIHQTYITYSIEDKLAREAHL